MAQYVYRANRVRKLKECVDIKEYFAKHPDAIKISNPPSPATMERWDNEGGYCKALDGCRIEPDGTCQHGLPSWLIALGYI